MTNPTTLLMNPGGIFETAGGIGGMVGNVDSIKAAMLDEGKKQFMNLDGGAGSDVNLAIWREFERRVDDLIRSGNLAKAGAEATAEHGQQGMQLMTRTLGSSAL